MSKSLLIVCISFSFLKAYSQKKVFNVDSLEQKMASVEDTVKIKNYFDICRHWVGQDKKKSIEAAQKALSIAEKMESDLWIARGLNVLIATLNIHGEHKNVILLAERALQHAERSQNKITIMEANESLSNSYAINSIWDKAIEATDKSLALATEIKDTIGMLNSYNMIALCNLELNNLKITSDYHQLAIDISKKIDRPYELGRAYAGLAELDLKLGHWEDAIKNSKLGAEAFGKLPYPVGIAQSLIISANALYEIGKMEDSKAVCNEILNLVSSAGNELLYGEAKKTLGKIEMEQKNYEESERLLKEAESLAMNGRDFKLLREVYHGLELLQNQKGNFDQSRLYKRKFEVASDSFFSEKILSNLTSYQVKYETVKKEEQLIAEKEKRNRLWLGSIFTLFLLAAFFFVFRNKQQHKQRQTRLEAENAQLQAELEHAEAERLREVDKVKSTFFANISHEFRTPLSLIISPLEEMMNGTITGSVDKYYRIMHRNANRLLELVNQLLDLSKLESGKLQLKAGLGDLKKYVETIIHAHESMAERKNIQILIRCSEFKMDVYFDKDKVEKIISNLISNAIKFSRDDGIIEVDFGFTSTNKNNVFLTVKDYGIGISQEHQEHLFERFAKSTISEIQPGSGIGLALTKELVELHGGKIEVISEEEKGSKFSIWINVSKAFFKEEEIEPFTSGDIRPAPTTTVSKSIESNNVPIKLNIDKKVILVVEDNTDVRSYIKEQLEDQYHILEAENGLLGLELARSNTPDFIITDVMMPEMNGNDFCKAIKTTASTSHIPVFILTARADPADKISGLSIGADDFLTKPFNLMELKLKINNVLAHQDLMKDHFIKTLVSMTPKPVKSENMDAVFMYNIRETIEANLEDETFSVQELAHAIGLSRSQLHRKLTALTGKGPNELIRNMRLERAKQLVMQKTGTVSEIAYKCGFNSPAYFIKCFKEYFGTTPGDIT